MTPSSHLPANASWIELSSSCVLHNVSLFRQILNEDAAPREIRLGCVLKGNAYGHGFAQMLSFLHPLTDVLFVILASDALAIRAAEESQNWVRKQVVVIGALTSLEVAELAEAEVHCVLGDSSWREITAHLRTRVGGKKARVHVHIDTGLGREGFRPERIESELGYLVHSLDVIEPIGVLTHFSNTEDVTEQHYAREQLAAFDAGMHALQKLLPTILWERHTAATAATLLLADARFEVVRVGIGLFGLWPSSETRISAKLMHPKWNTLKPVLSWRCRTQLVKMLPAGSYLGYGCSFRCEQDTWVGIFPVGYFDGYPRVVSSRAHVLVNGRRCAVLGRVMMNHIIVDLTHVAPHAKEVVATLLGTDGVEQISAETLAGWAQTINYEVITRIGAHLQRLVV